MSDSEEEGFSRSRRKRTCEHGLKWSDERFDETAKQEIDALLRQPLPKKERERLRQLRSEIGKPPTEEEVEKGGKKLVEVAEAYKAKLEAGEPLESEWEKKLKERFPHGSSPEK